MKRLLLVVLGLAALLAIACDKGDGGAPSTAALTPTTTAVEPAGALPCEPPKDITSYRYTWRFKFELPGGQEMAADLEATARAGEVEGLDDPLTELGMILAARLETGAANIQMDGALISPDRAEAWISVGDREYAVVQIGQESWARVARGEWRRSPWEPDVATAMKPLTEMCRGFDALFPDIGGSGEPEETPEAVVTPELPDVSGIEANDETINGIDSVHYHAKLTDIAEILDYLGMPVDDPKALEGLGDARYSTMNMTFDWWLAKEGNWPVRMEFTARGKADEGKDFSEYALLEVKDLNDPSIKIEPPVGE